MKYVFFFIVHFTVYATVFFAVACGDNSLTKIQTPSGVVETYITYSVENKFELLNTITFQNKSFDKHLKSLDIEEESSSNENDEIQFFPRNNYSEKKYPDFPSEVYLSFIRKEFPEMIFKNKLEIKSVDEEVIVGDKAKVSVILSNSSTITNFSWFFILEKINNEWKVFNITTESESKNFPDYPKETNETD